MIYIKFDTPVEATNFVAMLDRLFGLPDNLGTVTYDIPTITPNGHYLVPLVQYRGVDLTTYSGTYPTFTEDELVASGDIVYAKPFNSR